MIAERHHGFRDHTGYKPIDETETEKGHAPQEKQLVERGSEKSME